MKTLQALILAILITSLIATNFYFFKDSKSLNTALVKRVIDGDTLEISDGRIIRLVNINTPEKTEQGYSEAKSFLSKLENTSVEIEILGEDKYNRILARIFSPEYINLEIVKKGLGKKFLVEKSELKDFSEAERIAIKNSLGMWKHSEYYDCFKSEINFKDEIVYIENFCPEVKVQNWIITDESRKRYKFKNIVLGKINLHSKEGEDNSTDIYWNQKQSVWNNDRDSLYMFDAEGKIAHHNFYGYNFILSVIFSFRL